MIQPLKSARSTWHVLWIDLGEPVPSKTGDYFLPTLVIVTDSRGTPVAPAEVLEELDQVRVENHLVKLFDKLGAPDRVALGDSDEWDAEAWQTFSSDQKVEIRFQKVDKSSTDELLAAAGALVARSGADSRDDRRPRDVAIGLVNTALRVRSREKKAALLRTALNQDSDCVRARIEIADMDFQSGNWKACLKAYDEIIAREQSRWKGSVAWWADRETRPFLRAKYGRGLTLWHLGRYVDAAVEFEHLVTTHRSDPLGARFFVPLLLLLAEETEAAMEWFAFYEKSYPNDLGEPAFLFGWAFALGLEGREGEARARYREGILANIHIAPMLLEVEEPPRGLWYPNDRAEPNYAGEFIESYATLWDNQAGSTRLLREVWDELRPRIDAIVAHRMEMMDFQDQHYEPNYKSIWRDLCARDEELTRP